MMSTVEAWASPHQVDCREMSGSSLINRAEAGFYKEVTPAGPSFTMSTHDPKRNSVSRIIHEEGCWECGHLRDMLAALSRYEGAYLLDVGGNIGMWSLTAAAAGHQTFTVEALCDNAERFCESVRRNSFHDRIRLMNVAATSKPERFHLNVPRDNVGGTSVSAADEDTVYEDGTEAEGVTIDSLNLPTDRPVVMKVDVEGHELEALTGARRFLANADVAYVMMELRPNLQKDFGRWKDLFRTLASKGLRPYRINYEDETPLDVERLGEWRHFKHPAERYYDVVWRRDNFRHARNLNTQ